MGEQHVELLNDRRKRILRAVFYDDTLSRSDLIAHTGVRKNTVLDDVGVLLEAGFLSENQISLTGRRGRPRTPLSISTDRYSVVGISVHDGVLSAGRFNLRGEPVAQAKERPLGDNVVQALVKAVQEQQARDIVAFGITAPGMFDREARELRISPATGLMRIDMAPVFRACGPCPLEMTNESHAIAGAWLLESPGACDEDVIVLHLGDGWLGASLLVGGKPNAGCVGGSNEIGHTQLDVKTPLCYCGQSGCLERILSTGFLRQRDPSSAPLEQRLTDYEQGREDELLEEVVSHLGRGIGNMVNFIRPDRLVFCTWMPDATRFIDHLQREVRGRVLQPLPERVRMDCWRPDASSRNRRAAQLALNLIFNDRWPASRDFDSGSGQAAT